MRGIRLSKGFGVIRVYESIDSSEFHAKVHLILETRNLDHSHSLDNYCWDIEIRVYENSIYSCGLDDGDSFELWLMNEHGVKESRIKMLVTESNKIDPEKPQDDAMKLTLMEVLQEILVVRSIAYESGNP
ncbi:hypothetical protein POTOM_027653 [Populus tomentosa]|uniref:Uncharacterized protein n=1 Tax=Populus tomentosa TaxID=118781 RepID=A0A8X8CXD4_POPTO|nr:hypothetical protein POTOM_027653 [Populus tomentosa]